MKFARALGLSLMLLSAVGCSSQSGSTEPTAPISVELPSAGAKPSALPPPTATADAKPVSPDALEFDGFKLGDNYGDKVLVREPYQKPCDDDPIDKKQQRFMVYGALPCRERTFPEATTVAFFLAFSDVKEERFQQPIEALAWLGGNYFASRSAFPVRTGELAEVADKALGPVQLSFPLEDKGVSLQVRRHSERVWSLIEGGRTIGFAVGKMPNDAEREPWRALLQMYRRYTKPSKE
jgi:hypothetical protein